MNSETGPKPTVKPAGVAPAAPTVKPETAYVISRKGKIENVVLGSLEKATKLAGKDGSVDGVPIL